MTTDSTPCPVCGEPVAGPFIGTPDGPAHRGCIEPPRQDAQDDPQEPDPPQRVPAYLPPWKGHTGAPGPVQGPRIFMGVDLGLQEGTAIMVDRGGKIMGQIVNIGPVEQPEDTLARDLASRRQDS